MMFCFQRQYLLQGILEILLRKLIPLQLKINIFFNKNKEKLKLHSKMLSMFLESLLIFTKLLLPLPLIMPSISSNLLVIQYKHQSRNIGLPLKILVKIKEKLKKVQNNNLKDLKINIQILNPPLFNSIVMKKIFNI